MYEIAKVFAFVSIGICIGMWFFIFRVVTDHEKELDDEAQREFLDKRKDG